MSERRSKRRHPTGPIEVSSPTVRGQVLNLSMDGMAIESLSAIKPGKKISLKVDGEGSVVTGSVRWSKLKAIRSKPDGGSETIYHAGIQLERPRSESGDEAAGPALPRLQRRLERQDKDSDD